MAGLTPPKGRWVPIGIGISEFVDEETQHSQTGSNDPLPAQSDIVHRLPRTPQKSSERKWTGIDTPPPSEERQQATKTLKSTKASYSKYDYGLRELDTKGRKLHRLAFRWWDEDSQGLNSAFELRAGLYESKATIITPPLQQPELRDAFLDHLTPRLEASPFISVFESFVPALQRALKSDKNAYVSIIDLHQVEADSRKRFPHADEVIWPVKVIVKKYNFKLKHGYRGNEWLVHGIITQAAIVRTVKVADLASFARTARIRHMRDVFSFIQQRKNAFKLVDDLPIKPPKTNYRTGQLVGKVLNHINVPDEYKVLLARKIKNVMDFKDRKVLRVEPGYLRGVYDFENTESDSESDGVGDFIVDIDEGCDSDDENGDAEYFDDVGGVDDDAGGCYSESSGYDSGAEDSPDIDVSEVGYPGPRRTKRQMPVRDYRMQTEDSDSTDAEGDQALLDAQLHATEAEWMEIAPTSTRKTLRPSHIDPPKLTATQRAKYKLVRPSNETATIDLTCDADDEYDLDDDNVEAQPWTKEVDLMIISSAKKAGRGMKLTVRSSSMRSTIASEAGLARLEADARLDVMEVMQFD